MRSRVPRFQKNMRKGSAPGAGGGKPTHFGTPECLPARYKDSFFHAGGFRRLRAATYFAHGGKVGKTPPGTAPDEHFVLIVAFPRTPIYGGYPLDVVRPFRRAKPGVLACGPVRPHWGPEWEENWSWCGYVFAPAVSEPTSRGRFPP